MTRIFLIGAFLFLAPTTVLAGLKAEQFVEKEVVTKNAAGQVSVKRMVADTVAPGEEVIYSLKYTNESNEPADAVVLVMPVPTEVSYIEGTVAGENATVLFSADGGQTYVARGRLTVMEGSEERAAQSNDISHIKWTLSKSLAPDESGEVSYHAVLK